ncbi:TPA: hypothetical protein G8W61_004480 [Salmonella enterica]|uniref:Uncharacterized protein n=1 Tax=Salmonella enterica TaxID=28901 RepID=A0A760BFQ0_SALER|nr:hypothetical protein [Salmonella enterica]
MKRDDREILNGIAVQMKKGIEYINTGRIGVGKAWIEEAARDLNIMLTMTGAENGKESPDNE